MRGFEAKALDSVEHHERQHERGQLRVARVLQLVGVGVEQEAGDVTVGHLGRLADQLPRFVVEPRSSHARALRPLAGEGESEQRQETPQSVWAVRPILASEGYKPVST